MTNLLHTRNDVCFSCAGGGLFHSAFPNDTRYCKPRKDEVKTLKKRKPAKPGKEYKCSKCTNVIKMEGMVDRKILCTKCNAGFLVLAQKRENTARAGNRNTMYEKSFGKWKQYRLSDGVKHPIIRYNVNIKKAPQKRGNEDPPW